MLEENLEEGGYRSSACPGLGGYRLRLVDADARQNLFVQQGSGEQSLRLSELSAGAFNDLGPRVEWRGTMAGNRFRPDAMILRVNVAEDPNRPMVSTSYLLPVSLDGEPCVAARVRPGPEQNARARAVADAPMRCLGGAG